MRTRSIPFWGGLLVTCWLGAAAAQPVLDPRTLTELHERCDQRVKQLNSEYAAAKRSAATMKIVQVAVTALGTLFAALLPAPTARIVVAILTCAGSIVASFGGLLPDVTELAERRSLAIAHQRIGDSVRLQLDATPARDGYNYVLARYNNCVSEIPDTAVPEPPSGFTRGGGGAIGTEL